MALQKLVIRPRGDAQYGSFDKSQYPFGRASEKDGLHVVRVPFAPHNDHLDIVLNGLPVDFNAWDPFAQDHLRVGSIKVFSTEKLPQLVFRMNEESLQRPGSHPQTDNFP